MHFDFNHHPQHYFDLEHPFGQHKVVSRFRVVDAKSFVDVVPGNAPTQSDLEIFKQADLRSSKKEHVLY